MHAYPLNSMLKTRQWCNINCELFIMESHYDRNEYFFFCYGFLSLFVSNIKYLVQLQRDEPISHVQFDTKKLVIPKKIPKLKCMDALI